MNSVFKGNAAPLGGAVKLDGSNIKIEDSTFEDNLLDWELYRNNKKQNAYTTLQDAVDAATNGDTIKLTKNAETNFRFCIRVFMNMCSNNVFPFR